MEKQVQWGKYLQSLLCTCMAMCVTNSIIYTTNKHLEMNGKVNIDQFKVNLIAIYEKEDKM